MVQCRELLRGFEYECIKGSTDVEVSEVVNDSRNVTKDCLFICVIGMNFDGHSAAAQAAADQYLDSVRGMCGIAVSKEEWREYEEQEKQKEGLEQK